MAYTLVPTELIVDGAVTSAKLDTNISISGTLGVTGELTLATHMIMGDNDKIKICLLYTSPSPRDGLLSRMPSSA